MASVEISWKTCLFFFFIGTCPIYFRLAYNYEENNDQRNTKTFEVFKKVFFIVTHKIVEVRNFLEILGATWTSYKIGCRVGVKKKYVRVFFQTLQMLALKLGDKYFARNSTSVVT